MCFNYTWPTTPRTINENVGIEYCIAQVELGAKKLEVTILHQQMESLKQQVAMTLRGRLLNGPGKEIQCDDASYTRATFKVI